MIINKTNILEIQDRPDKMISCLVGIWEKSVRATHLFLSESAIAMIAEYVPRALREISHLIVVQCDGGETIAFMGVEGNRIEMLFLLPEERRKGIGKFLLEYGMKRLGVDTVCVNEQNPEALKFYERMGFQAYKRTEYDEQGNPFPLLYMNLSGKE